MNTIEIETMEGTKYRWFIEDDNKLDLVIDKIIEIIGEPDTTLE